MLHDLIKAANRNLAPGADPEKDWLKYADEDSCITREEMEDAEFIELEEGDEYDECEVCEEDEEIGFATLNTTIDEIGYDETLYTISDSEVLEDFIRQLAYKYGVVVPREVLNTEIEDLPFIELLESPISDEVTVEVEIQAFLEYLDN